MINKRIENEKLLYIDIDDSVVLWNLSEYPQLESIDIVCFNSKTTLKVHRKNLNLVEKFIKLGYGIIAWSQSGAEWAEAVCKEVGLDPYILLYTTKPRYILDDMDVKSWMGERIWRDPIDGEEK